MMLRPASSNRRQPLLSTKSGSSSARFAEVAGGTAAECAAVCCCCPCGLVKLLLLAIYNVPSGLCRRALKKRRRKQQIKKGLLQPRRRRGSCGCNETEIEMNPVSADKSSEIKEQNSEETEIEVMDELEKEMWARFYGTGFWRSPSQREPPPPTVIHCNSSTNPI